ncbi:MAG: tetratricopeptide repeat protein [Magnetococcales bacterium]|nr:tetratricopeptide repeat protein [Magnetococcales bacterium]
MMPRKHSSSPCIVSVLAAVLVCGCAGTAPEQDKDPEFQALLTKGQAYLERDKPQLALTALQEAQRIHPDNPDLLLVIATVYSKLGQSRAALDALQRAHTIKPEDPSILHNLGVAQLDEGLLDQAQDTLTRVTQSQEFRNQASAWYNLALVYQRKNQPDTMVMALQQAIHFDPSHIPSHLVLATFYNKTGQPEMERNHLEKIVLLDPENSDILERLGQNLLTLGRKDQARAIFKRLVQSNPEHPAAQRARERLLDTEQP